MNDALFLMSIEDAIKVCQSCKIYKGQCSSKEPRKVIMPPIHSLEEYLKYVNDLQTKGEYDILLSDDSMFQFEKSHKEILDNKKKKKYEYYRYCYVQSPIRRLSFEEYCKDFDIEGNEEYYREMYELDNDNMGYNNFPFYIRYDVDLKGYLPNSHSYAHLHIGFQEGYRLPVSIIMTPKAFVCMILKIVYSEQWKNEIINHSNIKERVYSALKTQCLNEKNPYWETCEENDLYIR